MGTYNTTCFITDMTIKKGTEVAVFIIKKREHSSYRTNLINDINTFFDIVTFPIFGRYNELGSLSKSEKTEMSKYYEQYFGVSTVDLIKIISEGREPFSGIGTIYEKYAVYHDKDKYGSFLKEESFVELLKASGKEGLFVKEKSSYSYSYQKLTAGNLLTFNNVISFEEDKTTLSYETYNYVNKVMVKKSKEIENTLEIASIFYNLNKLDLLYPSKINRLVDDLKDYKVIFTKKATYLKLVELSSVDRDFFESEFSEQYDKFIETLNEEKENKETLKDEIVELEEKLKIDKDNKELKGEINFRKYKVKESCWDSIFMVYASKILQRFEYNRPFKKIHGEIAFDESFKNEMSNLYNFELVLDSLGKYYRLPGYGSQYGTKREKLFIEFLHESVQPKKRIKKEN